MAGRVCPRRVEAGSGQISERFRAIVRTAELIHVLQHVLQDGRLVQQGAFDKLFHVEALFRDLAQRQMA